MQNINGTSSATSVSVIPRGSNNPITSLNAIPLNPLHTINGSGTQSACSQAVKVEDLSTNNIREKIITFINKAYPGALCRLSSTN